MLFYVCLKFVDNKIWYSNSEVFQRLRECQKTPLYIIEIKVEYFKKIKYFEIRIMAASKRIHCAKKELKQWITVLHVRVILDKRENIKA